MDNESIEIVQVQTNLNELIAQCKFIWSFQFRVQSIRLYEQYYFNATYSK